MAQNSMSTESRTGQSVSAWNRGSSHGQRGRDVYEMVLEKLGSHLEKNLDPYQVHHPPERISMDQL
jgi:hypothetical protein